MDDPLDIFKKERDGTLFWIAAVGQSHTAAALVAELSEKYSGEYRVLDKRTGEMIHQTNPCKQGTEP